MAKRPNTKPTAKPKALPKALPAHLTPGNPGNAGGRKGRSGPKSVAFVEKCEQLANGAVMQKVAKYLAKGGPNDPAWRWCAEYVSRYTKAEPTKGVELTGKDGTPLIPIEAIRQALRDAGEG